MPVPLPPGPRGLPLVGNMPAVARHGIVPVLLESWRTHGDLFMLRIGTQRVVVVAHPDGVERVLHSHRANYYKGSVYDPLRLLIGEGLATAEGDRWLKRRRRMQPAFHARHLAGLTDTMLRITGETLASWRTRHPDGALVEISEEIARLTFRIIGATLFGLEVGDRAVTSVQAFAVALDLLTRQADGTPKAPLWMPTPSNRRLRVALRTIDAMIAEILADARARQYAGTSAPTNMLGLLLAMRDEETGEALTDAELRDEIVTMVLAGHETVALTLTWALERLSRTPEVAERVAEEAARILGADPTTIPTAAESGRLRYTRMVVDEVLRVRGPAWIVARNCRDDDVIGGYRVPAGSIVLCPQFLTHRHPAFWSQPERLRPERFDPDAPEQSHEYAYYPFSKGPRVCIGNHFALSEATALLGMLLRACRFDPERAGDHGFRATNVLHPEPAVALRLRWR